MSRILIIDDDKEINKLIFDVLTNNNYEPYSAFSGEEALKEINNREYDLIILDLMLPNKSGEEVLEEIRQNCSIPIIVISAKGIIKKKVEVLKLGADDYLIKPFDLEELIARVECVIRRYNKELLKGKENILEFKDLVLNVDERRLIVSDKEIQLTLKEYEILKMFLENPKRTFSKVNIYERLWEDEFLANDDILNTHISNLRNKLKKANNKVKYIETVWGLGYRLCKD
ncbi:MAG: response regulator transcription factor [Clostridium sp.]